MENTKNYVTYGTSKEEARYTLNTDEHIFKAVKRFLQAREFIVKKDKDSRARVSDFQAARCLLESGETYEALLNMYALGFQYGYKEAAKKYKAKAKKEGVTNRTTPKHNGKGDPGAADK